MMPPNFQMQYINPYLPYGYHPSQGSNYAPPQGNIMLHLLRISLPQCRLSHRHPISVADLRRSLNFPPRSLWEILVRILLILFYLQPTNQKRNQTMVIAMFQDEYLRRPNVQDLERLLEVGQERGFPGMIGSIDCMHWQWKNCPKAWQGQFTSGHKGTSTVILEAVASYDLWIWHAFFGLPGSLNDINVLDRSPVFDDVESGEAPSVNFTVNRRQYNLAYYLADGIYPKWPVFVQSIQMPQGNKQQCFAKQQESCRKDVERAFGVLQARFAIVRQPARTWDLEVLGKIMRACIILHNMIVEDERDSYTRNWENIDFEPSNNPSSSASASVQTDVLPEFQVHVRDRSGTNNHTRAELRG
ncbi:hypothetical protein CASFOL_017206 [Castilleja foliolosa]|uniref:Nuclease HARBI1 n=1 Tax=Castilleja foliolosa TaxID=1961234 RepID=A0ABD3DBS8_9LAMI